MAWHVAIARAHSPFGKPGSVQVVAVLILAAFAVTVVLYLLAWLFPRQPDSSEAELEGASALWEFESNRQRRAWHWRRARSRAAPDPVMKAAGGEPPHADSKPLAKA
jgi:hypothetical protein